MVSDLSQSMVSSQEESLREYSPVFAVKLEHIVEKACMIPTVLGHLPEPRSQFCIWKSILRAVAMRQPNLSDQILHLEPEMQIEEMSEVVKEALQDKATFPAQVALSCLLVFLSLNFNTPSATSMDDVSITVDKMLSHARECIDCVVCAVITLLPSTDLSRDSVLTAITTTADRFMLTQESSAMYERIMHEIKSIRQPKIKKASSLGIAFFPDRWKARCVRYSARIAREHAPIDKLNHLIRYLQFIATLASRQLSEMTMSDPSACTTATDAGRLNRKKKKKKRTKSMGFVSIDTDEEEEAEEAERAAQEVVLEHREGEVDGGGGSEEGSVGDSPSSGWITYNSNVAALYDSGLSTESKQSHLTVGLEKTGLEEDDDEEEEEEEEDDDASEEEEDEEDPVEKKAKEDSDLEEQEGMVMVARQQSEVSPPDTDQLLHLFAYILAVQQRERVIDWFAECRFMGSELVNGDLHLMSGAQGYALVTLQQALSSILEDPEEGKAWGFH
eukprot:scaffold743_cov177-Ochromonas_danica.AAC.20